MSTIGSAILWKYWKIKIRNPHGRFFRNVYTCATILNYNVLNHFNKYSGMLIMINILCRFGLILCILLNSIVLTGSVHMVWMAPYHVPGSSLGVNASTSVPALALALQKIYNQGIIANNSVRYYSLYLLFYRKQCNIWFLDCIPGWIKN